MDLLLINNMYPELVEEIMYAMNDFENQKRT